MLRLGELSLALAPVLIVLLLYAVVINRHRPSARTLTLAVLVVTGLGTWLIWTGTTEDLDRGQRYVPARLQNGEVLAGHGTPP